MVFAITIAPAAFATPPYTSSLTATPNPAIVGVGTWTFVTAYLTLSSNTGTPSGTIEYLFYAGTCSSLTGSNLFTGGNIAVYSSNNGATNSYTQGLSTSSLPIGSYVWLVRYSGGAGWPATPTTGVLLGGVYYACEPITIVTHVPEFPAGLPLLLALALPTLLLLRRRLPHP